MEPKGSKELYERAVLLLKEAWPVIANKKKDKREKKTGFLLRALTGSESIWTLKDLDDQQLTHFIWLAIERIQRKRGLGECSKEAQARRQCNRKDKHKRVLNVYHPTPSYIHP